MSAVSQYLKFVKKLPLFSIAIFGAYLAAVNYVFSISLNSYDTPLALATLGLVINLIALKNATNQPSSQLAKNSAWIGIIASILFMSYGILNNNLLYKNIAIIFVILSILIFQYGYKYARIALAGVTFSLLILPFQENIILVFSYPLRLISSEISVIFLQLFGVDISNNLTTIQVGKSAIAITDACSGISQLGILALFAYLISLKLNLNIGFKVLWFSLTLPIVIIANSIRLIITILLFLQIGNHVFEDTIHNGLGYFFVILSVVLLYLSQLLFGIFSTKDEETKP